MDDCEIWEAVRATLTAPLLFKRAQITLSGVKETFIDGSFGCNNPALELCKEARVTFQNRKIDCILSIGPGTKPEKRLPRPKWCQKRIPIRVIPMMVNLAKACDMTHIEMSRNFSDRPNTYFRFSTDDMGQFGLEEWRSLAEIKAKMIAYLQEPDVNLYFDRVIDALYLSLSTLGSCADS
jgi:hypothetical protein